MLLKEKAMHYYLNEGLHCAEAIFLAASDVYHLGYEKKDIAVMVGFSGGIGVGSTCGLLSGSVAVLGILFSEKLGAAFRPSVAAYFRRFNYLFNGSTLCRDIKPRYLKPDIRCGETVGMAADLLEAYVQELQDGLAKQA